MARNAYRLALAISWLLLCLSSTLLVGQARHPVLKNKRPTLTLTNPVSGIKVVFYDPAFVYEPLKDSAWKKMSIYLPGQHQPDTITTYEGSGFMINDREGEQWSPDGLYMSVWMTYGIIDKDNFSGQRIEFVSLEEGMQVGFETKTGSPVTTDNFWGWMQGKPNTMLSESDSGALEEAKYIWK